MSATKAYNVTAARQVAERQSPPSDNSEQPGESTPTVFAPSDPTQQDLEWPQVLADCLVRLISAWRETTQCPHGTPSLPRPATVPGQASATATGDQQKGSMRYTNHSGPPESDHHDHRVAHHHHTSVVVAPNVTPTNNSRAGDPHDIRADHCPGDPEMPHTSISDDTNVNDKVLTEIADHPGHSDDRQSPIPLTAWPTQPGSPPDEDVMPKRVADGRRCQHHADNSTDIIVNVTHAVTQFEPNYQHDTMTSHTAATATGTTPESPTVTVRYTTTSSLNSRHRAGRNNPNNGIQSEASEETPNNPAGQPAITTSIAPAGNTLSPTTITHANNNNDNLVDNHDSVTHNSANRHYHITNAKHENTFTKTHSQSLPHPNTTQSKYSPNYHTVKS